MTELEALDQQMEDTLRVLKYAIEHYGRDRMYNVVAFPTPQVRVYEDSDSPQLAVIWKAKETIAEKRFF